MNYFSNICRICMSRDIELLNVYQSDDDMLTYIDKLNTCIPEIFTEKNYIPLPDQICELCCKNLKISFWFRELCLKSNTLFRAYTFKLETEPPQQLDVRLNEDKCELVNVKKEPDIDECSVNSVDLPKSPVQVMIEGDAQSEFNEQFIKSEDGDTDENLSDNISKELKQSPDIVDKLSSNDCTPVTTNSVIDFDISDDDSKVKITSIIQDDLQSALDLTHDFSEPIKTNIGAKLDSIQDLIPTYILSPDFTALPSQDLIVHPTPISSHTPRHSTDASIDSNMPALESTLEPAVNRALEPEIYETPQNKLPNVDAKIPELEMNIVEQVNMVLEASDETKLKSDSPKMRHLCPYCGKPFKFRQDMRIHERMHTGYKPYICHICNKSFAKNTRLKVHINTHTREKAYTCTFCNKIFNQNSNLIMHMKLHTQTERFACNLCDKSFSQKRHLKQHILFHEDEKRYTCEICNWNFTMKHHLKRHLMTHTGQRPQRKEMPKDRERKFPCEKCEWSFMSKEVLKRHMLVHTKDNPKLRTSLNDEKRRFPCPLCEWSFTKKHHLERHMCKHDDRKFVCHLCKEEFKKNYELQRHLKAHAQIPLGFKIQTY